MTGKLSVLLEAILNEKIALQQHTSGVCRFAPSSALSLSTNSHFWSERGNAGWFTSPEEAAINLAQSFGYYRPPSITDSQIDAMVIGLVTERPLQFTARRLRSLANKQAGLIPCAPARCDEAVKRLIQQGRIVLVNPTKRSSGVLQLAQYANLIANIQWINEPFSPAYNEEG